MHKTAKLALEDGTVFTGQAFGADAEVDGEVVFNTAMTGYQEILTDPSYKGQIVTMTYPLIGNYGINAEDSEAAGRGADGKTPAGTLAEKAVGAPQAAGFIVKEVSPRYSNYRANMSLDEYLRRHGVPGISGIDTRALTRKLRISGSMRGILVSGALAGKQSDADLVARARSSAKMEGADWVKCVMPEANYGWSSGTGNWSLGTEARGDGLHVVALDCGAKSNILRNLAQRGVRVTVVPPDTSAEQILALKPDGLFVSNGPGDPAVLDYAVRPIEAVLGKVPIFGICLGHQLLGRALGADTYKLKFGHRGGNQPVMNLDTGRVEITSQNHGFAVDRASLEAAGGVVTHINLNDGTVEGFRHERFPLFCVQYHPEASPGPHDAQYLFDAFIELMKRKQPLDVATLKSLQAAK